MKVPVKVFKVKFEAFKVKIKIPLMKAKQFKSGISTKTIIYNLFFFF